jgi:lysophospholipase L1-like esterase
MTNLKGLKTNILIAIISFIITLLFIEIFYQFFLGNESNNKRFLFITKPSLRDQNKSFGYSKNTNVREIAVYGNGKKFHIEYDSSFRTNNIGLVQKKPFDPKKKSIVIIGDSFTQGQGAPPWFYQLEDDWKNNEYQLINLGIIGTGMIQWKDTLQWFSDIGEIKQIFICCISDDWVRPRWYISEDEEQKVYAFNFLIGNKIQKNLKKPVIYFIGKESDHNTILKKAKEIADVMKTGANNFLTKFFLSSFTHRIFFQKKLPPHYYNEIVFSENKTSFDQIISTYGAKNITVLHLPQKQEVIQGKYDELGMKIKNLILSRHIKYIDGLALCQLNKGDFFRDDDHPNASGYKKIYACFSKHALENLRLE